MSSRYPRERSPPRHFERRPSATYNSPASTYRTSSDAAQSPLDRAPPRGPKADTFRGGYSSTPRGRGGFAVRPNDTWDRDRERDRDARTMPSYRRDEERPDWPRRDRDFVQRDRPAIADRRDTTTRERSASPDRPRRGSRESIPTTFSRPSDSSSTYYSPATRGTPVRGRGGRDWDRGRGRSSFVGDRERDGFYNARSRSREGWRDRDFDRSRSGGPDLIDRGDRFERRDYERTEDREGRGRDHDIWQRERSPARSTTGRPVSPGAVSTISHAQTERIKTDYDSTRKNTTGPLSARSDTRRESDMEYFASRLEPARREGPNSATFSQPAVPQSTALGLDYGPPPTVSATATTPVDKPAPSKVQPPKQEAPPVASVPPPPPPPSAPKADRAGPPPHATVIPRVTSQQFDPWVKSESTSRSSGTVSSVGPTNPPPEIQSKPSKTSPDLRTPSGPSADRAFPNNIPSGPRMMSGGTFKPRMAPNDQVSPSAPPTAPRQPKAAEARPIPGAPTGPRAGAFAASAGPPVTLNRAWVAPEYRSKGPSIMNQLNKPFVPESRERSAYQPSSRPSISGPGQLKVQTGTAAGEVTSPVVASNTGNSLIRGAKNQDDVMEDPPLELSIPASDDEDNEDEEGLDEDDFAASEQSHAREMKLLEARKPAPTLQDPITAALIVRVQLLGMIAHGVMPTAYAEVMSRPEYSEAMDLDVPVKKSLPSPEGTPEGSKHELEQTKLQGRPLSMPFVNPIPTPPIDDLPYLNRAVRTLSMAEDYGQREDAIVFSDMEDEAQREQISAVLKYDTERQLWKGDMDVGQLHDFYMRRYPLWRDDTELAEKRLREAHQLSPAPASPAPSATPSLPPTGAERTNRGGRNATDLDMQQAILMSQQSLREEEERRERAAASNAFPNYDTEAVVPTMANAVESQIAKFVDTSGKVSHDFALQFMAYIPPEDDFDGDEQLAFIAAYCQTPKKWGKIADNIPARTFQDCIAHYYLTKDHANYKEHLRRSQPKRRRGRQAVKPRANNLMSELVLNEDNEGTPAQVTDSGRPRRAAAPTFGDAPDPDATNAYQSNKRVTGTAKEPSESQPTKPTRGRKAGTATKTRRTKEKAFAEQNVSTLAPATGTDPPVQKSPGVIKDKARTIMKAEATPKLEPSLSTTLPVAAGYDPSHLVGSEVVSMMANNPPPVVASAAAAAAASSSSSAAGTPTSYWSVPEIQKFPQLVQYYGRDFTSIANFLKTKSSIMVKNYFVREVNNGKQDLERMADMVEQKKARGEAMGAPPTPVQPPKRRHEATPSINSVSRTAPTVLEPMNPDVDPLALQSKSMIVEDFPSNTILRNATGGLVANPRPTRDILQPSQPNMHVQPKVEESMRTDRLASVSKPVGPPRGIFIDEPSHAHQGRTHNRPPPDAPTHHQHAAAVEMRSEPPAAVPAQHYVPPRIGMMSHGREQLAQPPQSHSSPSFQPHHLDRTQHAPSRGHSRNSSLVKQPSAVEQQAAADLASLRNVEPTRSIHFDTRLPHSSGPTMSLTTQPPRQEGYHLAGRPQAQMLRAEPAKPVVAKRSNVHSILNDEPSEPPPKRASTDSAKRHVNTPPPVSLSAQPNLMQTSRHPEPGPEARPQYGHGGRFGPLGPDYPLGHSASPAPGPVPPPAKEWLDRFDLRHQPQHQTPQHQSSAGSYPVVPPSSQPTPNAMVTGRYDPGRGGEQSAHRRHYPMASQPSPPSQQSTPVPLHRSGSGNSSQHNRGPSMPYSQHQAINSPQVSAPSSYPQSNSSTPVSSLHRGQGPTDYQTGRRATIQEHLRKKEQRDHDMGMQRRDIDIMHSQPPMSTQQRPGDNRREVYAPEPQRATSQHMQPPPHSQTPQPTHVGMSYSSQPSGTYTPPHGAYSGGLDSRTASHGHHQSQPTHHQPHQYHSQVPLHHSHQHQQLHHQQSGAPPQAVSHSQPPPQQNQYAPHQLGRPLGPAHGAGGPPPPPPAHYRGYSQDDRR